MDKISLDPIVQIEFEMQIIKNEHGDIKKSLDVLTEELKLLKKLVVTGNGEISLLERFRNIEHKLDLFIDDVKLERERRVKIEAEEKKKKEDWNSRWFWALVTVLLPASLLLIYDLIIHLAES